METLKNYVKKEFYELHEDDWDRNMLIAFIQKAAITDSDVHDEIKDIDADDLIEFIADFDNDDISSEVIEIQKLMRLNAKECIASIVSEILDDIEDAKSDAAEDARQERRISTHQGY